MTAVPRIGAFGAGLLATLLATSAVADLPGQKTRKAKKSELLTLRIRDLPLKDVVKAIRKKVGVNILMDDGIDKTVTIQFSDVPWRAALDRVAESAGCVVIEKGRDVVVVAKSRRVSFAFKDASIRQVIDTIAKISGANIVVAPEVKGTVSLRLRGVPWRDALESVAKTLGYVVIQEESGILRVVPRSEVLLTEGAAARRTPRTRTLHPDESAAIMILREIATVMTAGNPKARHPAALDHETWGFRGIERAELPCSALGSRQVLPRHIPGSTTNLSHHFRCGTYGFTLYVGTEASRPARGTRDADVKRSSHWIAYAWPRKRGAQPVRTFLCSSTGALLTLTHGHRYAGILGGPPPTAGLEHGSPAVFASALVMPGKGQSGDYWTVLDPRNSVEQTVRAVDDLGKPLEGVTLAFGLPGFVAHATSGYWKHVHEPVPLGITRLKSQRGILRGLPATKSLLQVFIDVHGHPTGLRAEGFELEADAGTLVLCIKRNEIRVMRCHQNTRAAIRAMKMISDAQMQCLSSGIIDTNRNGVGEFGYLSELAGSAPLRQAVGSEVAGRALKRPLLGKEFGRVRDGRVIVGGYVFQMYLPGREGQPVSERPVGRRLGSKVVAKESEVLWCCYAWPVRAGETGRQALFVNQRGNVLQSHNNDNYYSGDRAPMPEAAFEAGPRSLKARLSVEGKGKGADGRRWNVIG
jgi:GspD-like, N0 domain